MCDAAERRPKREAVIEGIRILVLELYCPCRSTIGCLVNAKICGVISDRHQVRDAGAERLHIAELQRFRPGNYTGTPGLSAVGSDGECAVAAACPDYLR